MSDDHDVEPRKFKPLDPAGEVRLDPRAASARPIDRLYEHPNAIWPDDPEADRAALLAHDYSELTPERLDRMRERRIASGRAWLHDPQLVAPGEEIDASQPPRRMRTGLGQPAEDAE